MMISAEVILIVSARGLSVFSKIISLQFIVATNFI